MGDIWVWSLHGKIPWRSKWQPTPIFLPGKSNGQKSLAGYSPWGCKELDRTERLNNRQDCSTTWQHKPDNRDFILQAQNSHSMHSHSQWHQPQPPRGTWLVWYSVLHLPTSYRLKVGMVSGEGSWLLPLGVCPVKQKEPWIASQFLQLCQWLHQSLEAAFSCQAKWK